MVNKGSHFADFVRFRPHTYNLHVHSAISAALVGGNNWFTKILDKLQQFLFNHFVILSICSLLIQIC